MACDNKIIAGLSSKYSKPIKNSATGSSFVAFSESQIKSILYPAQKEPSPVKK